MKDDGPAAGLLDPGRRHFRPSTGEVIGIGLGRRFAGPPRRRTWFESARGFAHPCEVWVGSWSVAGDGE